MSDPTTEEATGEATEDGPSEPPRPTPLAMLPAWQYRNLVLQVARGDSRAYRAEVGRTLTVEEWYDVLCQHDHRCAVCGSEQEITMEHLLPIGRGGAHAKDNVLPFCHSCNQAKGGRTMQEWAFGADPNAAPDLSVNVNPACRHFLRRLIDAQANDPQKGSLIDGHA